MSEDQAGKLAFSLCGGLVTLVIGGIIGQDIHGFSPLWYLCIILGLDPQKGDKLSRWRDEKFGE